MILAPLQKLPENVGDLGKLINSKGFKKLDGKSTINQRKPSYNVVQKV